MAYDPFFGDGNGSNRILPKRPSSPTSQPGPLRVPNVQMSQPQVAPYAAPLARPGASPIQYPAPQRFDQPLRITASMMQPTPWTQGAPQPFPAPGGSNRLGRLGQTRSAYGSDCDFDRFGPGCPPVPCSYVGGERNQTSEGSCGPDAQCAGGLCEPLPAFAAERYTSQPRTCNADDECYSYEKCSGGGLCDYDPNYNKATPPSGRRRRRVPPPDYRKRRDQAPATPTGSTYGGRQVFGPGTAKAAEPVNPATGLTASQMEEAAGKMTDALICGIIDAYRRKQGYEGQSFEYVQAFVELADRVAQARKICAYAPKVAEVIQLPTNGKKRRKGETTAEPEAAPPVSTGRATTPPRGTPPPSSTPATSQTFTTDTGPATRLPGGVCLDGTMPVGGKCPGEPGYGAPAPLPTPSEEKALAKAIEDLPLLDANDICAILAAAKAGGSYKGLSPEATLKLSYAADQKAQQANICGYGAAAPAAAEPGMTPEEAAFLNEAVNNPDALDPKLVCRVLRAAAKGEGVDGRSVIFTRALAEYLDLYARARGLCGYPAPAQQDQGPLPTDGGPSQPPPVVPDVTYGTGIDTGPARGAEPEPEKARTDERRPYDDGGKPAKDRYNGGGGGGGGGERQYQPPVRDAGGGYVDPGTGLSIDYGSAEGGGGGGGGGQIIIPVIPNKQLLVRRKEGIPWWVWLLIVGGLGSIAYYAKKKAAGLAGHESDEEGKPLLIELENPEEV